MNQDKFLRVAEVAERLGIKVSTVRKKVRLREIGTVHLSQRCLRIPASEVQKIIDRGFVPARSEVRQ